jgi:uncharacterized membrane protein
MNIRRDLKELVSAGVISNEVATKIEDYYQSTRKPSAGKMIMVFGILGAILVGLGIILIIAHNWDEFSKVTKTFFAFLPLLTGQAICWYVLVKRPQASALRESGSALLFFAIGASIALVSQIYNIPGNFSAFLKLWMLLCIPVIYVMQSSVASLLYIVGITYYACGAGYWGFPTIQPYFYWVMLLLILPWYYHLLKTKRESNFLHIHNQLIPLSLLIVLGTMADKYEELMFVAYMSLFGLFYIIGNSPAFRNFKLRENGFILLGSLGTIILLIFLSFDRPWWVIRREDYPFSEILGSPEFIGSMLLTLLAITFLIVSYRRSKLSAINPFELVFLLFIIIFLMGLNSPVAVVLVNLIVLALGILIVRKGAILDHLGILNYGLIIIVVLVTCRFFDSDLNFIVRGLLFLVVGIGFFLSNVWMLKKRKENVQ